jgi:hypothetical protein
MAVGTRKLASGGLKIARGKILKKFFGRSAVTQQVAPSLSKTRIARGCSATTAPQPWPR